LFISDFYYNRQSGADFRSLFVKVEAVACRLT
jgi:hypothetical protein